MTVWQFMIHTNYFLNARSSNVDKIGPLTWCKAFNHFKFYLKQKLKLLLKLRSANKPRIFSYSSIDVYRDDFDARHSTTFDSEPITLWTIPEDCSQREHFWVVVCKLQTATRQTLRLKLGWSRTHSRPLSRQSSTNPPLTRQCFSSKLSWSKLGRNLVRLLKVFKFGMRLNLAAEWNCHFTIRWSESLNTNFADRS